jgi:hypothetical protein
VVKALTPEAQAGSSPSPGAGSHELVMLGYPPPLTNQAQFGLVLDGQRVAWGTKVMLLILLIASHMLHKGNTGRSSLRLLLQ